MNKEGFKAISVLMQKNIMLMYSAYANHEEEPIVKSTGTGCLAFINQTTKGMKALLELQRRYYNLEIEYQRNKEILGEQDEFMKDIFGEYDMEEISNEEKQKLHKFVQEEIFNYDEVDE